MSNLDENILQFGNKDYEFGIQDDDILNIIPGMAVESASIREEPEVNAGARNAQGLIVSRVVSKPSAYQLTGTFNGSVVDRSQFNKTNNFEFQGRFWIITNKSRNLNNQEFVQGSLEAISNFLITG